ncbi:class I SAM-dependent methyltransferase [Geodermatophilus aquaeductus]|uniref:Methyltransferase domain-containing protein n=1 Tax=Geodermatophilus aquaeductus TaxID=1564161 RepID=A0A521FVF1_9ACTN|nr:class I SAM-dependent methyltransferase [Geodermatophilus aquaeductus]SMO99500.1 Methyltransferase domain-containing protein [Geodermatophilus aquaeductus]
MTTLDGTTPVRAATVDDVADRVFASALGAFDTLAIHLGDRVGWYRALAGAGALTPGQLAARTGTDERYAREWLEQQAAGGWLAAVEPAEPDQPRRFELPAAAAEVFTDRTSLVYLTPLARFVAAAAGQLPALAAAYRDGGGVSWAQFGDDARTAQADMNRPWYERELAPALHGVPDLEASLARPGARIADVGCGEGWSTIALARAYPDATVHGVDADVPSVAAARDHAAAAGLGDRVTFTVGDAATELPDRDVDALFAFECLHDLPHPVAVLQAARRALRPGGVVVVMDEAAQDRFTAPASDVERLLYGFSTLLSLPDARSHTPSAATGTVIRASTVRTLAVEAGFTAVDVLPIEDFDFWRFYRLQP